MSTTSLPAASLSLSACACDAHKLGAKIDIPTAPNSTSSLYASSDTDSPSSTPHSPTSDDDKHHPDAFEQQLPSEMMEQSPIDISVMESHRVQPNANHDECAESVLGHVDAELTYHGSNFQINWKSKEHNYLKINGKVFHTVQFHFHTPSEHTINGKQMDMEFHLVHQADDGNLAVIALFFQEGDENKFLAQFWDELPGMHPENRSKLSIGKIQGDHLNLLDGDYFRYRGSLTTPPYPEGVEWIVLRDVAEASRAQLDAFRDALDGPNAREVQPLNERIVRLHL